MWSWSFIEFQLCIWWNFLLFCTLFFLKKSVSFLFLLHGSCPLCFSLFFVCWSSHFLFCLCSHRSTVGYGGRFSGGFDINVFEKVHKTGRITFILSFCSSLLCPMNLCFENCNLDGLQMMFLYCLMFLLISWRTLWKVRELLVWIRMSNLKMAYCSISLCFFVSSW